MGEIELHDAFIWDCDNCGRENLLRCMPATQNIKLNENQEEQVRQQFGLEPWEPLEPHMVANTLVRIPNCVTCKYCETAFATIPPGGFMEG